MKRTAIVTMLKFSLLVLLACNAAEKSTCSKFILKASNNLYVALNTDSVLVADEPDESKAEVFEKIKQANGKLAFKALNGKFVSDERKDNNTLIANRNNANEWEQFEIIITDSKIYLKSAAAKFVSADRRLGNRLTANRNQPGEWETFFIEPK